MRFSSPFEVLDVPGGSVAHPPGTGGLGYDLPKGCPVVELISDTGAPEAFVVLVDCVGRGCPHPQVFPLELIEVPSTLVDVSEAGFHKAQGQIV